MKTSSEDISEQLLLKTITTALSRYIAETDPTVLFNGLLDTLLELTNSEYGFIGEVFYTEDQTPFIKSYATTNIAWSEETQRLYEDAKKKGMVFSRPDSLYGAVLKTGQLIIANDPASDSRSCGIPQGHPPLNSFMGIPFYAGKELLGVVGIANRENGYHQSLATSLAPFLETCGNLIQAYRNNIKKQQLEDKLQHYQQQLLKASPEPLTTTLLGSGYSFTTPPPILKRHEQTVILTPKEMTLLGLLVDNVNQIVSTATLESVIWKNVIVSESSLRSLLRRLRKKIPELEIQTVRGFGFMLINKS
jgi:transcriptional regulator with GAF, ATPase, and Fis domain